MVGVNKVLALDRAGVVKTKLGTIKNSPIEIIKNNYKRCLSGAYQEHFSFLNIMKFKLIIKP